MQPISKNRIMNNQLLNISQKGKESAGHRHCETVDWKNFNQN